MPRFAVPCTIDELKKHFQDALVAENIEDVCNDDPCWSYLIDLTGQIEKDLGKVEFDFENFECDAVSWQDKDKEFLGFHMLPNGMPFLGCYAGGDWEYPVFFIFYWSGTEVRAYIPKDGNTFNKKTKQAYGNGAEERAEDGPEPDFAAILADIQKRIVLTAPAEKFVRVWVDVPVGESLSDEQVLDWVKGQLAVTRAGIFRKKS